ncbi:hypothetical protein D3C87_924210 [compost metagenome]
MLPHLVLPLLPESELTECQSEPRHHAWKHAGTVDIQEQLRVRRQVIEQNTEKQHGNGRDNTVSRHSAFGQFPEEFRSLSILSQRIQHSSRTVNPAVTARHRGGKHDEIDNASGSYNADLGKSQYERAANLTNLIPWIERNDNEDRAHIEDQNTPNDVLDCFAQSLLRILRFTCCNSDQLNPLIGRRDDTEREQESLEPASKKATVAVEIRQSNRMSAIP